MDEKQLPNLTVEPDANRWLIEAVFDAIRKLNVEEARDVVLAGTKRRTFDEPASEKPKFSVIASDGPVLNVMVGCGLRVDPEVRIEPDKLDRTNPELEDFFQRCAAIVAFMKDAPATDEGSHAVYLPFDFWKAEGEGDVGNWEALAEIWAAAVK